MDPALPPLPTSRTNDDSSLEWALESAEPIALGQAWKPSPACAPGSVRIAWCPDSLLVRAELEDSDVFTKATRDNERLWEMGDTFEVFLEAEGAGYYTEMHVAPCNRRLHLKIRPEDYAAIAAKTLALEDVAVDPPDFQSRFEIIPFGWAAELLIPAWAIDPAGVITRDSRWRGSFCRYDAASDGRPVELSSTSPHRGEINFHTREDWRPICF